jgi:exodeoxyribonuclease V alpha subunit
MEVIASLASVAVGAGNICLNLAEIAGEDIQVDGNRIRLPVLKTLRKALEDMPAVGRPGEFCPLVLDGGDRLYLYRYWKYEQELARVILEKASAVDSGIDTTLLASGLRRLFPHSPEEGTDWQMVAAAAALRKRFCVISGGPGTGKTSTVVKILALLIEQKKGDKLRVALAAPTGKSAARLGESIRMMKENLDCSEETRALIPEEVSTIHRLLGSLGATGRFRYSEDNPLPFEVVIVDEASMVALPLMARLATALSPDARLIVLGDREQLASVEAGAVLGDICGRGRKEIFSKEFSNFVEKVAGEQVPTDDCAQPVPRLIDSMVVLKRNYRFGSESGIGEASRLVNAGKGEEAVELLQGERFPELGWYPVPKPDGLGKALLEPVVAGYAGFFSARTPEEALKRFDDFRILCALRQGPYGVLGVNRLVEQIFAGRGLVDLRNRWYHCRPVMVTVNDYNLKLFNGDVGILFQESEADGNPRVYFMAPDGGLRDFSPLRLPAHETVYAMTIHKSQGSEFDRVLLLLPGHDSEVLSRELIYTGITRAKNGVDVWSAEEVFRAALSRNVDRKSGLREKLWS